MPGRAGPRGAPAPLGACSAGTRMQPCLYWLLALSTGTGTVGGTGLVPDAIPPVKESNAPGSCPFDAPASGMSMAGTLLGGREFWSAVEGVDGSSAAGIAAGCRGDCEVRGGVCATPAARERKDAQRGSQAAASGAASAGVAEDKAREALQEGKTFPTSCEREAGSAESRHGFKSLKEERGADMAAASNGEAKDSNLWSSQSVLCLRRVC